MVSKPKTHRAGFTVIELIVSISLITLLAALIVPAVQRSRCAADAMLCKNRLKQVGIAAHDFHSAKRHFPDQSRYMFWLLPYLEQENLHALMEAYFESRVPGANVPFEEGLGAVPALACPSNNVDLGKYEMSFVVNAGHQETRWSDSDIDKANGMLFRSHYSLDPVRISDVRDGTSNTVLFSEQLPFVKGSETYFRKVPNQPTSANDFRQQCLQTMHDPSNRARRDTPEILSVAAYKHINLPNEPSCYADSTSIYALSSRAASSSHSGGVNALLVDGSVRFVAGDIDVLAWRELGSRNSDIGPTEIWD